MFKDKLLFRRLALLLCLSLIVSLIPITAMSMPVVLSAPAPAENLITNGDFQTDLSSWNGRFTSGDDKVEVIDGAAQFTATSAALWLVQTLNVTDADDCEFTLSLDFTRISGSDEPYLMIKFRDATPTTLIYERVTFTDSDQYEIVVTAPAGTAIVEVELGNNSGVEAVYTIDNISLTREEQEPASTGTTEATESTEATAPSCIFEDFVDGSAAPDVSNELWVEYNGDAETVLTKESGNYKVGRGGNNKLVFQAPAHNVQYYAKSPLLPATAGNVYAANYQAAYYFGTNAEAKAQLIFVDAQGNVLNTISAEAFDATAEEGTWVDRTVSVTAPAGTAGLYVKYTYLVPGGNNNYWVRNLAVTESVPATPAVSSLLINGDFEQGTTAWKNAQVIDGAGRTGAALRIDSAVKGRDIETAAESRASVTAGQSYDFTFYAKRDASDATTDGITAYVLWYDANGDYMTGTANYWTVKPGTEWTPYEYTVEAPAGAAASAVRFYGSSSFGGIVYVDDVVFNEEAETPPDPTDSTEPSVGALLNGGFEDGVANWTGHSVVSSNTQEKHGGNASMQFVDDSATTGYYVAQSVAVEAGKTYKLSAWVKIIDGAGGYFGIYGLGTGNNVAQSFTQSAEWTQNTITVTIPAGVTEASIELGTHSSNVVTYLIDDVTFEEFDPEQTETTEATETTEDTETTEATDSTEPDDDYIFRDFVDGSAVPDVSAELWKEYNGDAETVLTKESGTFRVGRGGNNKLVFQAGTKNVAYYAKSPVFAVTGGKAYTAAFESAWYFENGEVPLVELIYVDAQGNVLATTTEAVFDASAEEGTWTDMKIAAVAPSAATGAYLKLNYLVTGSTYDYWVRNLGVVEGMVEEEPTQPGDPNLMLEENFENLVDDEDMNSGPKGWISSDDAAKIYSIAIACAQKDDIKLDGNYLVLQMVGNWTITSPSFAVKPGFEYDAQFMERKLKDNTNYNGYLSICFVDVFGLPLAQEKVTIAKTYGQWSAASVKAVAPAGAVEAYLVFGLDNDDRTIMADYAIDSLKVIQSAEPVIELEQVQPAATRPVYQDSFDEYETPEGASNSVRIPKGWTASKQSAAMASAKYDDYDGTYNLCLQDKDTKWIRSPFLEAVPGNTYTALFMERKLNPSIIGSGGYVRVAFVDAEDNVLEQTTKLIGQASSWSLNGIQAQAPAGAVKFYVEFGIENAAGGSPTFSVENLEIIESEGTLPTTGNTDSNPETGDEMTLALVSTVLVMTVACAVVVLKKRRSF